VSEEEKKSYSVTWEEIKALLRPAGTLAPQPTRKGGAKITEEQKRAYMQDAANLCPFCKSWNIEGGRLETDGRYAWQEATCKECRQQWRDVYTLSFVQHME
jgi:hypothetical protein